MTVLVWSANYLTYTVMPLVKCLSSESGARIYPKKWACSTTWRAGEKIKQKLPKWQIFLIKIWTKTGYRIVSAINHWTSHYGLEHYRYRGWKKIKYTLTFLASPQSNLWQILHSSRTLMMLIILKDDLYLIWAVLLSAHNCAN